MIENYLNAFKDRLVQTEITNQGSETLSHDDGYQAVIDLIMGVKQQGGIVYLVGNGGSSGIISHSSIDFINACKIAAHPLTDNSILTCLANDYGYENVFSKALEINFSAKDVLIAVSSSGSSQNILNAAATARSKGGKVITFSGFKPGNPLRTSGDYNFWIDSDNYGKVEIGHALLLHILTDHLSALNAG